MIYWTTKDGRKVRIKDLGDEHLINIILMHKVDFLEVLSIAHIPGFVNWATFDEEILALLLKEAVNRGLMDTRFRILGNIELFPGQRVERKYQITGKIDRKQEIKLEG